MLTRLTFTVWLAWLGMLGLMVGLLVGFVPHPHFLPMTALLAILIVAGLALIGGAGWRLIRDLEDLKDPLSGELFVFISRRAIQVKILYFDRSEFCVWSKRLETGHFISDWRSVHTCEMDWTSLKLLLEGIVPAQQRKRFRRNDVVQVAHRA